MVPADSDARRAPEISRPCGRERDPRHQAFEILDAFERLANLRTIRPSNRKRFDRVQAIPYPLQDDQRPEQPGAHQAAAHRRDGPIDLVQKRSLPRALGGLDHLEVLQRRRIDQQRVGRVPDADAADVRQLRLLRVAQVAHQRAGRGNSRLPPLEPEAVEAAHAQLIEQGLPGAVQVEVPAVHFGDRQLQARHVRDGGSHIVATRHYDLARPEHGNLVLQRLEAFGAFVLRDVELAGREVEQRDAVLDRPLVRVGHGRKRQQERRLAGVQECRVRQGSG